MKSPKTPSFADGLSYYYADANADSAYTLSSNTLGDSTGAIANTIGSVYNANDSQGSKLNVTSFQVSLLY